MVKVQSPLKFTMFLPDQLVTQQINAIKLHLQKETFELWFTRGSIGALLYISLFAAIMYWLSIWITQPIVQFTRKIELNIEQVRKLKQGKHQGKKLSQI